MKSNIITCFLIICASVAVGATEHTVCYNYFLKKDGCVHSAADDSVRCKAPPKPCPVPVPPFSLAPQHVKRSEPHRLQRRYDTTEPSFPVAGGNGICGFYNSTTELGVCLWSGAEQNNPTPETAGWLDGPMTANCGKKVYIQRTGKPETVQYARILDGCSFNTKAPEVGCFQIGLSLQLFEKFNPTEQERADQLIYDGLTWDFDSLNNQDPQQGPV